MVAKRMACAALATAFFDVPESAPQGTWEDAIASWDGFFIHVDVDVGSLGTVTAIDYEASTITIDWRT